MLQTRIARAQQIDLATRAADTWILADLVYAGFLDADPTVDGSEFELKRALVALWNLVLARLERAGARVVDDAGFILTGLDLLRDGKRPAGWPLDRDPFLLETSVPGIFACGDVRSGPVKLEVSRRVLGRVGLPRRSCRQQRPAFSRNRI